MNHSIHCSLLPGCGRDVICCCSQGDLIRMGYILKLWTNGNFLLLLLIFPFIGNGFFSYWIYPGYSFPFLYSPQLLPTSLPSRTTPFLSHIRKQTSFYGIIMTYNKIIYMRKHKLPHQRWTRQTRGAQEEDRRFRDPLLHILRNPRNWKPWCVHRGPAADPHRPVHAAFVSLSSWILLMLT